MHRMNAEENLPSGPQPPQLRADGCELMIVMPVYNEQASIRKVVMEWFQEVENWTENFLFVAINDGSGDDSLLLLNRLQKQLGARLEIISRPNKGHGQSCIEGYRLACGRGVPFVLQIDSDGQCDPQYFFRFWRMRKQYDVIYGHRRAREDGFRRVLASIVLKLSLLAVAGVWCVDANVPYRLMKTAAIEPMLPMIPADFSLANVGLAVLLKKKRGLGEFHVPIRFRERYGGEPSVRLSKFGEKAFELFRQIREIQGRG